MGLGLRLQCHQELALKLKLELEVFGGTTQTVFPKVEKWLEEPDHINAVRRIPIRRAEKYESLMDFIFCELFPEEQKDCFLYYKEKGPKLLGLKTKKELCSFERRMLAGLALGYRAFEMNRRQRWYGFKQEASKGIVIQGGGNSPE